MKTPLSVLCALCASVVQLRAVSFPAVATQVITTDSNSQLVLGYGVPTGVTVSLASGATLSSKVGSTVSFGGLLWTPATFSIGSTVVTPGSFGLTLLGATTSTSAKSSLGLTIGTNVEAYSAALDGWAATSSAMATLFGDGTSPNTILPALECTIIWNIIWRLLTETPLQALLPDGAAKGGGLVAAGYGHDSRTVALGGSTAYPVKILVLGVMEGNNEYSGGTDRGLYYEDGRVDPDLEKTDGINECWLKVTSGGSSKYYYLNHGDGLS
ncbi:MAG: hypothetical protein WCL04_08695, partial [Verrucomicrobiota bacterium]